MTNDDLKIPDGTVAYAVVNSFTNCDPHWILETKLVTGQYAGGLAYRYLWMTAKARQGSHDWLNRLFGVPDPHDLSWQPHQLLMRVTVKDGEDFHTHKRFSSINWADPVLPAEMNRRLREVHMPHQANTAPCLAAESQYDPKSDCAF